MPAPREGRADVALVPRPFDDRGLDAETLLTEPRLVARSRLRLADLADRVLPDGAPADREGDGAPSRHLDLAHIFNLIELGRLVWFPPLSVTRRHPRPGIAYRPVDDLRPPILALAWPEDSRSSAVAALPRTALAWVG
ncbi:hypothetical protein [Streptomyces radicis]|uniref:hypothetical protein n=1 Tax=Streptomyces radicis TaxID=1750517 RepID=UPI0016037C2D|nr:hypothetical protein [Streptomyces radicis]